MAEAAYQITVRQRGDVREASGFIRASAPALFAALKHRQPILRLQDGGEIIVVPTQVDMAGGAAEVLVSGPVAGFWSLGRARRGILASWPATLNRAPPPRQTT